MRMICQSIIFVLAVSAYTLIAHAVPGNLDYNTYMYKQYQDGWQSSFSSTQWVNYNDWNNEMDDIADCYVCSKNTQSLGVFLSGNPGLNADLIAYSTHGTQSGSTASSFQGWLTSYENGGYVSSRSITPIDEEVEIYLGLACSNFSKNTDYTWYAYRNAHRYGARVHTGCWGTCTIYDTTVNTTWNEIGDSIADSNQTIWNSWKDGLSVGFTENPVIIYGLGRVGSSNCDNRARNVSLQNRLDYQVYTYGYNEPLSYSDDAKEFCGYYTTLN